MKIAIFLDHINYSEIGGKIKKVLLFSVDDNLITAVGEDMLSLQDSEYLRLWLMAKEIQVIFSKQIDNHTVKLLHQAGISVRDLDEIRTHPVLQAILYNNL